MKILVFADTHGSPQALDIIEKKAKEADLLICAGDFTIFENQMQKIFQRMNKFGKKILLIHGNHESEQAITSLAAPFENITFLHKKVAIMNNILFFGFGGGGFSFVDREFEAVAKDLYTRAIAKYKPKKTILILHGPPFGTALDELYAKAHCGNKSYASFVKKYQPDYVFAGHIHECFGKQQMLGKSFLLNPGPQGKFITI